MKKKNEGRQAINGILLVNKPEGFSSNAVLQQVKQLYQAKKAGHTGSLDPLATGMLPICFGEATKFSQYLLAADKCYAATGLLGVKTDSSDAYGKPIQVVDNFSISPAELCAVLEQFKGRLLQTPSMFSALKHQGVPLYRYARSGITIERKAREIMIRELTLQEFDGKNFAIKVCCSKGTYIRNLIEDIGDKLTVGAHVTRLHRQFTAPFTQGTMYTLEELMQKTPAERLNCLLPVDEAVINFPALRLSTAHTLNLRQGKALSGIKIDEGLAGYVRLYNEKMQFFGLGELKPENVLTVKRLLTAEL